MESLGRPLLGTGHGWGGWAGPVFWPFIYGDIFTFALWPYDYYDPFWSRRPLEVFYDSLSDEQKQRFENMGSRGKGQAPAGGDVAALCIQHSGDATNLPIQRIEQVVQPNSQQQQDTFAALKQASRHTADQLQASCPSQVPHTPLERLDTVKSRLQAIIDAMNSIRSKLQAFYASLSDDQKARFNTMAPPQNAAAATQGSNR